MGKRAFWSVGLGLLLAILNFQRALASPHVQEAPGEPSIEEKVGQFLFIGISGVEITESIQRDLKELKPGGVILFKRNISTVDKTVALTSGLQKINSGYSILPLILATDQEGGRVSRIAISPPMPSPLALGKTKDPQIVEDVSFEAAKFLHHLGFNMNLAPVLDVLMQSGSSFIGERSFGWDPKLVGNLGVSFAQGQLRAGVIPTSKHFPGVGLLKQDPHVQIVSLGQLNNSALDPFKQFAAIFPSAVMISHSSYPSLDPSRLPATYSHKIIHDILLGNFAFRGLVITDDLQMGAAKMGGDVGRLAVQSFKAGADLIMVTWPPSEQKAVRDALVAAVKSGEISNDELSQRLQKIAKIKHLISASDRNPASIDHNFSFESKRLGVLDRHILFLNMKADLEKMPHLAWSDKYAVVGKAPQFKWAFERAMGKSVGAVDIKDFSISLGQKKSRQANIAKYDRFIIPVYSHKEAIYLNSLPKRIRSKSIVVNCTSPGLINDATFLGVINLFHPHAGAGRLLGEQISGHASNIDMFQ